MPNSSHDAKSLTIAVCALLAMPLAVLWSRPRTLAARDASELLRLTQSAREETILREMQRFQATSLNFDAPATMPDRDARWRQLQIVACEYGASETEADEIIRRAKQQIPQRWPLFIERAWLNEKPVWLVCAALPKGSGERAWVCNFVSDAERRAARVEDFCGDVQIAVVRASET